MGTMEIRQAREGHELSWHLANTFYSTTSDSAVFNTIETNADRVLAETGVRFDDPETVELLRSIGGETRGDRVILDGVRLRELVRRHAPSTFRLRARNPARDATVGGPGGPQFAPMYGAPDVLLENGERVKGTLEIYREIVAMSHASPGMTNTGHMVCVIDDVDEEFRSWAMLHAHLAYSDKPFMGCIGSPEIAMEYMTLTQAAVGRAPEKGACHLVHLVNSTPPLTFWENPLRCLRRIAEAGEASMISSYMMMGATSPATIAGSLTQGYAEVLAGLAVAQLWNPGCPVIMGILAWPFDMRTMQPRFGDPASQLVQYHSAELARRLGVPSRGDGAVTSSKVDDAQAGSESARNLAATVNSGAGFVLHSAGWLEQGRCISIGKLRRDALAIDRTYFGDRQECNPPPELDSAIKQEILGRVPSA